MNAESTIHEVYDLIKRDVADHEARMRSLEKWIWRASGIAAAVGAVGGSVAADLIGRFTA